MLKNTDAKQEEQTKDGLRREDPVSIYPGAITLITPGQLPGYRPTRRPPRFRHAGAAVLWGRVGMELPRGLSTDDNLISETCWEASEANRPW